MSNHGSGSSTKPWRPPRGNMATYPSVGRFENKPQPTLYVKGSSPKLEANSAKISMAPHSNHGQLTQHPSSGIVDLRTAPATAGYKAGVVAGVERYGAARR
ncbi:uncharacterized protein [Physcomitrium patens]|uniref:uncharacterized protein isoform X3 n=1 Tax=Physcomitrium patens TaxID=3218 RepID=UPI003CCD6A3C